MSEIHFKLFYLTWPLPGLLKRALQEDKLETYRHQHGVFIFKTAFLCVDRHKLEECNVFNGRNNNKN